MIYVMISNGLIILMTILAVVMSANIALILLLSGGLMISITVGYIGDGEDKLLNTLQVILAVLFALCVGKWWGCLVFVCIIVAKPWQILLMEDGMLVAELILEYANIVPIKALTFLTFGIKQAELNRTIALWILYLLVIDAISGLVIIIRYLIQKKNQNEAETEFRIKKYSLSELREAKKNRELSLQNFYAEKNARLIERENISRNIHNSVGHSITAAIMTLDAADMLFDKRPNEAHKKMLDATTRIRGSLGAIRSAVRALDDETLDVSVKDIICYFDNILNEFLIDTERSCERIYEIYNEEMLIPREHVEFLTGALEECLTNGVKHGDAKQFIVKLTGDSAHIKLEVKDDGKSNFDVDNKDELIKNGFGLKKLISYADRYGGVTEFKNEEGFRSIIELPVLFEKKMCN
ncbi:MAG: hypothetical protein IKN54_08495 [Lachnospiraceae bacterium]|nr:hypothetical protein [Lachnospiraceae bacterium]